MLNQYKGLSSPCVTPAIHIEDIQYSGRCMSAGMGSGKWQVLSNHKVSSPL